MPEVEREYWSSQSGPAWSWWVLAILPLETLAQVVPGSILLKTLSQVDP